MNRIILTDEDIIEIFSYIRKGMTMNQIAEKMDKGIYDIQKATSQIYISQDLLARLFSPKEIEQLKSFGYPLHKMEVGPKKGDIYIHPLTRYLRRKVHLQLRHKNEKTCKIEQLYDEGWKASAIAKEVGCSKTHVYRMINTYEKEKEIE